MANLSQGILLLDDELFELAVGIRQLA
jgi:hypothetical protein